MKSKGRLSLIKLPAKMELVVAILSEELKAEYFYRHLEQVGFGDCRFRSGLGSVVLALMNFDDSPDDLLDFYVNRLDHYCAKLKPDSESFTKQAFKFYSDLKRERKRRV
jgi:hypothetical protein